MTPRSEALAFRIWAYAEPREWNVSAKDVGEALGVDWQRVNRICRGRGWSWRMRTESSAWQAQGGNFTGLELARETALVAAEYTAFLDHEDEV